MKRSLLYTLLALLVLGLGAGIAWSQDDPFAGLGGGGDSTIAAPDGSSSIRAKRKASKEMFEGIIMQIDKGKAEFPMVESIKVKVTKKPLCKTDPHKMLKAKQAYEFVIHYVMKDGKLDMENEDNRTNIGAYYFQKGDKIQAELLKKDGDKLVLKFIERK